MRMTHPFATSLVLATLALAATAPATAAPTKKPNVLYVFSDMQRANSMGCYGDTNARTPTLDTFASQGIRLDAAISPTPVCCPHRANLMSGQYAHHHGMMSNGSPFKPTVKCIAESFRDSGYATGYVGKWHLGAAKNSSDPTYGFPAPNTPYGVFHFERDPDPTTDIALKFIAEKSRERAPWMLFVSWIWPHSPYKAPPETLKHFSKVSLPPNVPPGASREYAAENLPDYYGMIEALDQQFARLLQALKTAGVAEDTIVVYSSDHGDMIGSQGYKAKRWPYEESARVPFLIRYPRALPAGRVIADPFGTPDVYPTLAGLAGVPVPKGLDGVDFSAFFTGQAAQPPREYVYLEMHYAYVPWPGWRAIRTRDLMFARTVDQPWLLFDLTKDPWEKNNLVNDPAHQPLVKQMDERLANLMKESGDSWTLKATSGDLSNWLPGASKQQSQNLGVPFPGQVKGADSGGGGGRKRKKAAKQGDDDGE